jgi:hypothetical protein
MVKIGHARSSETKSKNGVAGDQTGNEVSITEWYNAPWLAVFRPTNKIIAERIALFVEKVCANDYIGYSQNDRLSLYNACLVAGFHIEYIKQGVNCDCSSLVACACISAGLAVNPDMTTAVQESVLMSTNAFDKLTQRKYLQSYDYLKRGDILWKIGHTATALNNGDKSKENNHEIKVINSNYPCSYKDYEIAGSYTTITECNMREYPSLDGTVIAILGRGVKVRNYGYYNIDSRNVKWLFAEFKLNGYVYQGYISEKVVTKND